MQKQANSVSRSALINRVLGHSASLVLFVAPAGFGKTTAMAQLREAITVLGGHTAWWPIGGVESDQQRFLTFLRQVLRDPAGGDSADLLSPFGFSASVGEPIGLFLDDFEGIADDALSGLVLELVRQLPPGSRVVIGSRRRPDFKIAHLKAQDAVLEFGVTDLQFSEPEIQTLMQKRLGQQRLSRAALMVLQEKTFGWPAAVALASMAMAHQPEGDTGVLERLSVSMQPVAEYLSEVVLDQQPREIRDFLLCTSILHYLEPAVCKALAPWVESAAVLEQLTINNLFVSQVPGSQASSNDIRLRYHPVFAEFLRVRLLRERPDDFRRLHLAASSWFESEGFMVAAIDHALAGGDYPYAAELMSNQAMGLLSEGRLKLLSRWFAALPALALRRHPRLIFVQLWTTTFTQGPNQAMRQFERIGDDWMAQEDAAKSQIPALRCTWLMMLDRPDEAHTAGLQALTQLPTTEAYADSVLSVSMAILLGQDGQREAAHRLLHEVRRRQGDVAFMRMFIDSAEGEQDLQDGLLLQASARLRIAAGASHADGVWPGTANGYAWAGVLYAFARYEAGELELAARLLKAYAPVVQAMGAHDHLIIALVCLSRIARVQGDADEAAACLAQLEHAGMARGLPRLMAISWIERSRVHVLAGRPSDALAALERGRQPDAWAQGRNLRRLAHSALDPTVGELRWSLHFGDARRALVDIDTELARARSIRWPLRCFTLELLRAVALSKNGRSSGALDQLAGALGLAFEQGLVRRVVDEGPSVLALASQLLARERGLGSRPEFIAFLKRLLTEADKFEAMGAGASIETVAPTGSLTRKELEVLQLLAEGYSNQRLSDELGVSETTVRTHLRNINAKLDVASRMEAVARARQIGLLG